ncbi:hypothetical protein RvY_05423 [Ramazzottius varieornatus]|uniref:Uncharacterized protein n=1 Tax=Ramazzottius varieornatus TaxID=947166 RepID=A0A1D1V4R9_RAMVA|nr:hypothetical protein RvY_05423 [Ramazzottius varieornatus]
MTANQLATATTQPDVSSISPGAPAIQPSSLRVSQASSYHASGTRRARRINLPSGLPGSEGEPKSAKKTLATDSKDPTAHMD